MAGSGKKARQSVWGWLVRSAALLFLLWFAGFIVFIFRQVPAAADSVTTDGIAVLTGGPGRLKRGVAIMESGHARRMLISGVDKSVRPPELAEKAGIPARMLSCCIDLGFAASSTATNADEVAQWVARHRFRSVRLVTAGYHMHRARLELQARLPADVVIVPDGVSAGLPLRAMHREYAKLLGAWLLLQVRRP